MDTSRIHWTENETQRLIDLRTSGKNWHEIAEILGRTHEACRYHYTAERGKFQPRYLKESPFPRYNDPLVMEGDALVIPDLEMPFHHAEFVNRCLELAQTWNITQCIVAGDVLHFDSVSSFEPNWMPENHQKSALTERDEANLVNFLKTLGSRQQERGFALLDQLSGGHFENGDPNISQELSVAREGLKVFSEVFDLIDFLLGNHEGRLLKALQSPMMPNELLHLLDLPDKWRISPYYYGTLISADERFHIEHPKSSAKSSAYKLAAKFCCHVLQGHSHRLNMDFDPSGRYYAWHIGHCVDESRLPYAAQRHTTADAHLLGAAIVRDGVPWMLHERVDWKRLALAR